MPTKILAQTDNMPYEDWLEYRKLGIGGSDASAVCGISRYKSPVELWMEKTDQLPHQEAHYIDGFKTGARFIIAVYDNIYENLKPITT